MTECKHKQVEIETKLFAAETRDMPAEYLQRGVCKDCGETMEVEDIPAPSKTRAEVEDLKAQWKADPCWDLESTDGFDDHFDELKAFAQETERKWAEEYHAKMTKRAEFMKCSFECAQYITELEMRIEKLEVTK